VFLVASRTWPVAVAFGVFAAYAPVALVRFRARQRRDELRELWPDAVDNLASAVRAGLSLPEALTQLGVRGPEPLRGPFQRFGEDYRASARLPFRPGGARHRARFSGIGGRPRRGATPARSGDLVPGCPSTQCMSTCVSSTGAR
jgi:hypothetical protein